MDLVLMGRLGLQGPSDPESGLGFQKVPDEVKLARLSDPERTIAELRSTLDEVRLTLETEHGLRTKAEADASALWLALRDAMVVLRSEVTDPPPIVGACGMTMATFADKYGDE